MPAACFSDGKIDATRVAGVSEPTYEALMAVKAEIAAEMRAEIAADVEAEIAARDARDDDGAVPRSATLGEAQLFLTPTPTPTLTPTLTPTPTLTLTLALTPTLTRRGPRRVADAAVEHKAGCADRRACRGGRRGGRRCPARGCARGGDGATARCSAAGEAGRAHRARGTRPMPKPHA